MIWMIINIMVAPILIILILLILLDPPRKNPNNCSNTKFKTGNKQFQEDQIGVVYKSPFIKQNGQNQDQLSHDNPHASIPNFKTESGRIAFKRKLEEINKMISAAWGQGEVLWVRSTNHKGVCVLELEEPELKIENQSNSEEDIIKTFQKNLENKNENKNHSNIVNRVKPANSDKLILEVIQSISSEEKLSDPEDVRDTHIYLIGALFRRLYWWSRISLLF